MLLIMKVGTLLLQALAASHYPSFTHNFSRIVPLRKFHAVVKSGTPVDDPIQSLVNMLSSEVGRHASGGHKATPVALKKCLEQLDLVTLQHVQLTPLDMLGMNNGSGFCYTLYETHEVAVSAFMIPAGGCIPLHNHPNMTVLTKLLSGNLMVRSFSELEEAEPNNSILAALDDGVDKEGVLRRATEPAWALTPRSGNFHELYAVSNSLMLDVFLPPYDNAKGRCCTYFKIVSDESVSSRKITASRHSGFTPIKDKTVRLIPASKKEEHDLAQYLPIAIPYYGRRYRVPD